MPLNKETKANYLVNKTQYIKHFVNMLNFYLS